MAVYSVTRADLRQELAMMMQDDWASTATGGSTTTVVDTKMIQNDNFWRNAWVLITATNNNLQVRQATGFTASSDTLTFAPAVALAVANADTYELFKRFRPEVYHQAINQAIREVGSLALVDKVDTSLTLAADTWEYTLPSGFRYIRRLSYLNDSTDDTRVWIPNDLWYIRFAGTRKIVFDGSLRPPANTLTIEGQSSPAELSAEATACPVQPNYALAYGKWYLHSILAGSDDEDAAYHERQMLVWEPRWRDLKAEMTSHVYPGSKSVEHF